MCPRESDESGIADFYSFDSPYYFLIWKNKDHSLICIDEAAYSLDTQWSFYESEERNGLKDCRCLKNQKPLRFIITRPVDKGGFFEICEKKVGIEVIGDTGAAAWNAVTEQIFFLWDTYVYKDESVQFTRSARELRKLMLEYFEEKIYDQLQE